MAFSHEMIHDTRIFYTDRWAHLSQNIRPNLGDSRARWEGDELVVETTNHVLQYQFTVDDPVTCKAPFTMSMPLTPRSGGVILPYECHEGNGAVKNALSAERAEDAALHAIARRGAQEITAVPKIVQGLP